MKRSNRLVAAVIAFVLGLSLQTSVIAQEQQVEQPSPWALDGVQWSAIYGLVGEDMLSKYVSNVNREDLISVCVNLYERISGTIITPVEKSPFSDTESTAVLKACAINMLVGSGQFEPQKEATRLEMVINVFAALKAAQTGIDFKSSSNLTFKDVDKIPVESLDVVKYAVSKGVLNGRNGNVLDLYTSCSRQELMVFVRKAYECVVYETKKDSKGAFWKVSDEDSTVYLLGSVHAADPSLYPLSKAILNAYEESEALVVEANIANQQEGTEYMQQKMMYSGEDTLDKNISKEVYDRFVEYVTPLGLKAEMYNKFKPWYAAMLVESLEVSKQSYNANLGVDLFFTVKALEKKDIIEIEGLKFQIDMFDSFSKELQLSYLESVLNPDKEVQESNIETLKNLMDAWKKGNIEELEKLLSPEEESTAADKEYNEKMWTTRNDNMAQKAKDYLADPEKKTYFIIVGAGHMVGDNGVVAQLEDNYKVEQIK